MRRAASGEARPRSIQKVRRPPPAWARARPSVPVQAGRRWPVERTHAWANQYGKLRWCTERRRLVVEFWLALAGAAIVCGRLVRRAWTSYRWDDRPHRRP
jgi:hypothetical protein